MDSADLDLAAILLAYDEGAKTENEFEMWRKHWMSVLPSGADAEHFGDCTKVAISCRRCLYDEIERQVKFVRSALRSRP